MATANPFSWVVRFTVAPLWVQDGFVLSDEVALDMLAQAIPTGFDTELQAKVLEAPEPLQLVELQGYDAQHPKRGDAVKVIEEGHGEVGLVQDALASARDLLDSVAFVSQEGDTAEVLNKLRRALSALDPRQGEAVPIEE